jgi:hypothetical protein
MTFARLAWSVLVLQHLERGCGKGGAAFWHVRVRDKVHTGHDFLGRDRRKEQGTCIFHNCNPKNTLNKPPPVPCPQPYSRFPALPCGLSPLLIFDLSSLIALPSLPPASPLLVPLAPPLRLLPTPPLSFPHYSFVIGHSPFSPCLLVISPQRRHPLRILLRTWMPNLPLVIHAHLHQLRRSARIALLV